MKYIKEDQIFQTIEKTRNVSELELLRILSKARLLKGLSLDEVALLLQASTSLNKEIFKAAAEVKNAIYGQRVVLFAPLYISNACSNGCLYCAFKSDNTIVKRKTLTREEVKKQTEILLKTGHKRILMVAGENAIHNAVDYFVDSIHAIYEAEYNGNRIRRVNINCAPLSVEEFQKLKTAGIGTYQLFQETYHEQTYRKVHPWGPKADPDNRIDALDRAFAAGIDDVGVGVLYGLYDYIFETLALLTHIQALEKKHGVGPHTISVPRIEPAVGSDFSTHVPYQMNDDEFKKVVAVLRLAVPYTGIILSTRENASLRDELFMLGISQVSAASRTAPGGYDEHKEADGQFDLSDTRSLDQVMESLILKGFIPSFCAACYRKERTGSKFMSLAKPGLIKGKCSVNALVTLKEYLDDFASDEVKQKGYRLINDALKNLSTEDRQEVEKYFKSIDKGVRDEYV